MITTSDLIISQCRNNLSLANEPGDFSRGLETTNTRVHLSTINNRSRFEINYRVSKYPAGNRQLFIGTRCTIQVQKTLENGSDFSLRGLRCAAGFISRSIEFIDEDHVSLPSSEEFFCGKKEACTEKDLNSIHFLLFRFLIFCPLQ